MYGTGAINRFDIERGFVWDQDHHQNNSLSTSLIATNIHIIILL